MAFDIDMRNMRNGQAMGPGTGDEVLFVQFRAVPIQDKAASDKEGRPIFKEQIEITITTPGTRSDVVNRKARLTGLTPQDNDTLRFPKQWEAFKANKEQAIDGTPLEEVTFLSVSQVAELKAMNVRTLEQLGALDDAAIARCGMGTRRLVEMAKARLLAAKEAAPLDRLSAENAALREQIKALNAKVDQLATDSVAPRRGKAA